MSYEKHSWVHGETITPALLNHMEDGIASGGGGMLIVQQTITTAEGATTYTLDKTWKEIDDAMAAGIYPIIIFSLSGGGHQIVLCYETAIYDGEYCAQFGHSYSTDSEDGYPSYTQSGPV